MTQKALKTIAIELKLFVTLSAYLPESADNYPIPDGQTIDELILGLELPEDLVKLIFVNGRRQERDYQLQHGDRLGIFPPVGGG